MRTQKAVFDMIRKQLFHENCVLMTVISNSMYPLIQAGDRVLVKPVSVKNLNHGDIIVYHRCVIFCSHRFVCRHSNGIVAKGDQLKYFDPLFTSGQLIGKIVAVHKQHKRIDLQHGFYHKVNFILGNILDFQWYVLNNLKPAIKPAVRNLFHLHNRLLISLIYHRTNHESLHRKKTDTTLYNCSTAR